LVGGNNSTGGTNAWKLDIYNKLPSPVEQCPFKVKIFRNQSLHTLLLSNKYKNEALIKRGKDIGYCLIIPPRIKLLFSPRVFE
jgi:hypothetical protein